MSERLVHRQFVDFLSANKKLVKTQSGNRKLHSTETALLCVTNDLLRALDDKKVSVIVLLDMSKAFDSIRHDILLWSLSKGVLEGCTATGNEAFSLFARLGATAFVILNDFHRDDLLEN